MKSTRSMRENGQLDAQVRELRAKLKKANRAAAKEIEKNIRKFGIIADAAERDLKKVRGAGKNALRIFRTELKRSWKDLRRIAQQQF